MRRVIRRGVFETNSSSVHSMVICNTDEWLKFKNDEKVFDYWTDTLVDFGGDVDLDGNRYYSYEDIIVSGWFLDQYETYYKSYTTESGDTIHIFGYYGHD